ERRMDDGLGERHVSHTLAPNLGLEDLDAAALADDPAVFHALVLAAGALVVPDRPKDALAEQAAELGLEGPIVDGLGPLDLAVGALADFLGIEDPRCDSLGREAHADRQGFEFKGEDIDAGGRLADRVALWDLCEIGSLEE